ncbi:hypothetical protein LEP1GSC082_2712 [Leptospira kirschneri str. H2]|uniref:Uncharacterized protein n=2 Tax=Leptospira kirschneri TaxID=29507 RepID=A0A0E2B1H8_9LEPT|nr:hypothetical protein LEP1GSC081_1742 [Leptospira kirschneri str. H1]EKO62105.1 hypothetical protein LEP1GSC082_2712 [Leptospira kirschneri str. H2]EMK21592.1 hypothetical protein LEP1GSC008_4239 [Leptospira kirschneri serovar Bulgarica str. Nikolaevo]
MFLINRIIFSSFFPLFVFETFEVLELKILLYKIFNFCSSWSPNGDSMQKFDWASFFFWIL